MCGSAHAGFFSCLPIVALCVWKLAVASGSQPFLAYMSRFCQFAGSTITRCTVFSFITIVRHRLGPYCFSFSGCTFRSQSILLNISFNGFFKIRLRPCLLRFPGSLHCRFLQSTCAPGEGVSTLIFPVCPLVDRSSTSIAIPCCTHPPGWSNARVQFWRTVPRQN